MITFVLCVHLLNKWAYLIVEPTVMLPDMNVHYPIVWHENVQNSYLNRMRLFKKENHIIQTAIESTLLDHIVPVHKQMEMLTFPIQRQAITGHFSSITHKLPAN